MIFIKLSQKKIQRQIYKEIQLFFQNYNKINIEKLIMKKIVFVQKEDGSTYDPVSAFFANKKAQSASKPSNPTNSNSQNTQKKTSNNFLNTPKEMPSKETADINTNNNRARQSSSKIKKQTIIDHQETNFLEKQKAVTGKIGRKGEHLPPTQTLKKQEQSIYNKPKNKVGYEKRINAKGLTLNNENSKKAQQRKQSVTTPTFQGQADEQKLIQLEPQRYHHQISKQSLPAINQNSHSKQINQTSNIPQKNSQKTESSQPLKKRIRQLEEMERYYVQKIEELESKEQQYIKNEQKNQTKVSKQAKNLNNQNKELLKKIAQKEQQIKKLMTKDDVSYNKKRQLMLSNQIRHLKKINRQLTLRIKNYKGTDLVEISVNNNKTDILLEYDHDGQQPVCNHPNFSQIQTTLYRLANDINNYVQTKTIQHRKNKEKTVMNEWGQQKKMLLNLMEGCKKISIEIWRSGATQIQIPQTNQQCKKMNLYNQIQLYKGSLDNLVQKNQLNFIITEENIQLINKIQENHGYLEMVKQSKLSQCGKQYLQVDAKKFKKVHEAIDYYRIKIEQIVKMYERYIGYLQLIIAQNIAQHSFSNSISQKTASSQKEQFSGLLLLFKEIQDLCELKQSGKQALYLYMQENIGNFKDYIQNISKKRKKF